MEFHKERMVTTDLSHIELKSLSMQHLLSVVLFMKSDSGFDGEMSKLPEMKCFFKYQFILTAAEVQMENINGNHTLFAVQYHLSVHPELEKMQLYLTETLSNVPGIPPLHPLRRSLSDMETVLD